MRQRSTAFLIAFLVAISALVCLAETPTSAAKNSLVLVYKDGHQKAFSATDATRIEFRDGVMVISDRGREERVSVSDVVRIDFNSANDRSSPLGRNHFLGKWKVGEGAGMNRNFYITLKRNGEATKSIGSTHGTWVVVNGEARIAWDDGWRDVIRKVGSKHEKVAYEPGKSLDDEPSNVTNAVNLEAQPI